MWICTHNHLIKICGIAHNIIWSKYVNLFTLSFGQICVDLHTISYDQNMCICTQYHLTYCNRQYLMVKIVPMLLLELDIGISAAKWFYHCDNQKVRW